MSFETKIPDHLKDLRKQLFSLKWDLRAMYHQCDCDHCDITDLLDDYTEEDLDAKEAEIKEVERLIARLKRHAKLFKIEVPA